MNTEIKITPLENLDDLELLVRGDVVQLVYQNIWNYHEENHEFLAAYRAIANNLFQFLVPTPMSNNYITIYQALKERIQVKDTKIFLKEDKCAIETIGPGHYSYEGLNGLLISAGLRNKI